jgi:hypothetical protein
VLRKAELSVEADAENYLGGSSETICTTSDLTHPRGIGTLQRSPLRVVLSELRARPLLNCFGPQS